MSDPSLSLQKALYEALVTAGVCGGRVYDRVPDGAVFPYATIADDTLGDASNTCFTQDEAFVSIHVWSRAVGHVEVKQQAALVRGALDTEIAMEVPFKAAIGEWDSTRYPPSEDALTAHAVLTFRYLIQH